MDFENFLRQVKRQRFYKDQIIFKTRIPPKEAVYGELNFELEEPLQTWLDDTKIKL
ncbi:MAG: hypothetical protein ACTSW1_18315 [Candidatus Hodarchaeales archaeon]